MESFKFNIGTSWSLIVTLTYFALVDVGLTKLAGESQLTLALEAVDSVDASGVVLARVGRTLINVNLTIDA